ncbi:hypothetical protein C8F01DRAFT_266283 [Mycena amicta]|nr:hypothetical protein C8F01DRAFT_266283 [Mycena amicta]
MFPELPQELLDEIVARVDETRALKACSLSAPQLRAPSQRVLLSSLTVTPTNAERCRAFLIEESPHVASYITSIRIPVVDSSYPTLVRECIVQILDCLTSVQRCAISPRPRGELWELGLEPSYEKSLVAFLQRQPLRKLHVERIRHMSVNAAIHLVV